MLKLEHFQKMIDQRKQSCIDNTNTDPVCTAFTQCSDCVMKLSDCFNQQELDAQVLMDSFYKQSEKNIASAIDNLHNQFPELFPLGEREGETCFRDGCDGEIMEYERESCSCHINPPCSACVANRAYCPKCDWHGADE